MTESPSNQTPAGSEPKRATKRELRRKQFKRLLALAFVPFALLVTEVGLRVAGRGPQRPGPSTRNDPLHLGHEVLGWVNRESPLTLAPLSEGAKEIPMTFWAGGLRATAPERTPRPSRVAFVGGSCTQGMAIPDADTWPWKLQAAFPEHELLNYGTGGYGTYQSLLRLEELLGREEAPPKLVIYGFATFHGIRNVAHRNWLKSLRRHQGRGHVNVPYCTLEGGDLVRHPPAGYPSWPGSSQVALISFAQDLAVKFQTRGRRKQRVGVTQRLIKAMHELCEAKGSRLLVAVLIGPDDQRAEYERYFDAEKIRYVDVNHRKFGEPGFRVEGDGHPNAVVTSSWAEQLAPAIREALR